MTTTTTTTEIETCAHCDAPARTDNGNHVCDRWPLCEKRAS